MFLCYEWNYIYDKIMIIHVMVENFVFLFQDFPSVQIPHGIKSN